VSFWYDSKESWINELKDLIAIDIPVITLMHFEVNGTDDGHYRVVVGYDENKQSIIMNDPWDRDDSPRLIEWSEDDFVNAWNILDDSNPQNPFFGVAIFPWKINPVSTIISNNSTLTIIKVTANITYPCMIPFKCSLSQHNAHNSIAILDWHNTDFTGKGTLEFLPGTFQSVLLNTMKPTDIQSGVTVSWLLVCKKNIKSEANNLCKDYKLQIEAKGVISGVIPEEQSDNNQQVPSYNYIDVIGNIIEFSL